MQEIVLSLESDYANEDRLDQGESLLYFPDSYTVIDIETSGVDTRFDEIIEVAAIKYVNGCETARFQSLIQPDNPVDVFIESLTGITNEMLATAPDLEFVLPKFREFVGTDLLVGQNVSFDIRFIDDYSGFLNLEPFGNDYVDTLRIARRIFPDLPNHKLETICKRCGISNAGAHRAIVDCEHTHECLSFMEKYTAENDLDISNLPERSRTKKHRRFESTSPKDITPTTSQLDPQHPLYGKNIVFTGELSMDRRTAMQLAVDVGAVVKTAISGKSNFLVVGDQDPAVVGGDGLSSKQRRAVELNNSGKARIIIISEKEFLDLIASPLHFDPYDRRVDGKSFALFGDMHHSQEDLCSLIEQHGGTITKSFRALVNSNSYAVIGFNANNERLALQDLGVSTITEEELLSMLGLEE